MKRRAPGQPAAPVAGGRVWEKLLLLLNLFAPGRFERTIIGVTMKTVLLLSSLRGRLD